MKIRLTCTGTRPLLMHNGRLASRLDPQAKKLKALNAKRNKTDADLMDIARAEFEGSLYLDDTVGPHLPAYTLLRSLVEGGRLTKSGKKVERGVVILGDLEIPLLYPGPRTVEGLWGGGDSAFVDIRPARIGMAKVDRCRPIFRTWEIETELLVDPKILEFEEFVTVATDAGQYAGLGDYRQLYGRFAATAERL